ncbi:MAG: TetR/AcrR family transcriptional regulator [Akkermansiaceae bacterium]|jgi:TetR/AcrR family transcriptional regulator of autoinduction and epiphytic fitness|nr:TetR/AcrR family transcriptional regulator [Akkermansiaceae bacterium]
MGRSEEKRAAIVQAAIEEFSGSCYALANMDAIAARAGVSKRTVYNHFDSKEALFLEISTRVCEQLMSALEMPYDPERAVRDQLLELAGRHLELVGSREFQVMTRIILPERVRNPDLVKGEFDRLRRGERGLGPWMRQAMEAGVIRTGDWASSARKFGAMLAEFGFWPQLLGHEKPLSAKERKEVAERVVDLFLNGVGAAEKPARRIARRG